MDNYKLIACDLDGTLLRSDMSVSGENLGIIKKLSERGIYFVPTTGRALGEIPSDVRDNPNIRYIISSNGAVIFDTQTRSADKFCIEKETSAKLFDLLDGYDTLYMTHANGSSYVDAGRFDPAAYSEVYHMSDNFITLISTDNVKAPDFENFCRMLDGVEMLCVFFASDEELCECKEKLKEFPELSVASSAPHNIEISSKSANKGAALKFLAAKLGIDISETVGIGDSENDSSLLSATQLSVAPENALEPIKAMADEIVCDNNGSVLVPIFDKRFSDKAPLSKKEQKAYRGAKRVHTKLLIGGFILAFILIAIIPSVLAIIFGDGSSHIRVGYIGNQDWDSWSGRYTLLDGEMSHTVHSDTGKLYISVETSEGSISVEVTNANGDVIFSEANIGTEEFELDASGRLNIKINADGHKGSFVIGDGPDQ